MGTITVIDPNGGTRRQITINVEASMIVQNLLGEVEFFVTLSTSTKDVNGQTITKQTIESLSDGAGGAGLDRYGSSLSNGKYASLTTAINDYTAMMVEGRVNEPLTEMDFS